MKSQRCIADELLDPKLKRIAGNLTAAERLEMAATSERWAKQLRITAQIMELQNQLPKKGRKK